MSVHTVSIIIPVYNSEKYLARCLESVLSQTYTDLEVIIVDDGSTDSSNQICIEYAQKDKRVRVYKQENKGASAARNFGLRLAEGNLISFVDSDDAIDRRMIEILYNALMADPQYDFSWCSELFIKHSGAVKYNNAVSEPSMTEVLSQSALFERFFRIHGEPNEYSIWGKLYKRKTLSNFELIEGRMNEDIDGVFQVYSASQFAVYVPLQLYFYYQNPGSITNSKITMKKMDLLYIWEQLEKKVLKVCPEFHYAWKLNRQRASFTLLAQSKINGFDKSDKVLCMKIRELKHDVRANFFSLMRCRMSLSRKMLLVFLCIL